MRAIGVVLGVLLGLGLESMARATVPKVSAPLVINGLQCPDPCPIRDLRRAIFEMKSARTPGANGVAFRLKLWGAEFESFVSSPVVVRATVALSFGGGPCIAYTSPSVRIVGGKATLSYTGGKTTPATPETLGDLRLCDVAVAIEGDTGPFAVGPAILLGPDPD